MHSSHRSAIPKWSRRSEERRVVVQVHKGRREGMRKMPLSDRIRALRSGRAWVVPHCVKRSSFGNIQSQAGAES